LIGATLAAAAGLTPVVVVAGLADGEDFATAVDAGFALEDFAPDVGVAVGVHAACGELPTGVRFTTAGGEYTTEDAGGGEVAGDAVGAAPAGAASKPLTTATAATPATPDSRVRIRTFMWAKPSPPRPATP